MCILCPILILTSFFTMGGGIGLIKGAGSYPSIMPGHGNMSAKFPLFCWTCRAITGPFRPGIPVSLMANSEIIGKDGSGRNIGTGEERTEELENAKEKGKREMPGLN